MAGRRWFAASGTAALEATESESPFISRLWPPMRGTTCSWKKGPSRGANRLNMSSITTRKTPILTRIDIFCPSDVRGYCRHCGQPQGIAPAGFPRKAGMTSMIYRLMIGCGFCRDGCGEDTLGYEIVRSALPQRSWWAAVSWRSRSVYDRPRMCAAVMMRASSRLSV